MAGGYNAGNFWGMVGFSLSSLIFRIMDINSLTPGENIAQKFAVLSVYEKTAKNGSPFLSAHLCSSSGIIKATVFSEDIVNAPLKENKVFFITAQAQCYQNELSLIIRDAKLVKTDFLAEYFPKIDTVVFDIETVGQKYSQLSDDDKKYLIENLETNSEPRLARQRTGLHPLFGTVIFVAMMNPETKKGKILGISKKPYFPQKKNFIYKPCSNETELLTLFWQQVEKYQRFVTFNGKRFDVPFLIFRSLVNKVSVPIDLNRSGKHIDLLTSIRPYGTRAYKLEAICKALGLSNPKDKGISGLYVAKLFRQKKIQAIIDYVAGDVVSTTQLYKLLQNYAPLLILGNI